MIDLTKVTDKELVVEVYRRIKGESEMHDYLNYLYRAAFRPIYTFFDKQNIDAMNIRTCNMPNWDELEAVRNEVLNNFPNIKEAQKKQQRIGKFIVQDGIATDTETSLTWLRFELGQTWQNNTALGEGEIVDWKTAFEMANQFNQQGGYASFTDWRLPTIEELENLFEGTKNKEDLYINVDVFPKCLWAWSSSLVPDYINYGDNRNNVCVVNFRDYGVDYYDKNLSSVIRLVRDGQ